MGTYVVKNTFNERKNKNSERKKWRKKKTRLKYEKWKYEIIRDELTDEKNSCSVTVKAFRRLVSVCCFSRKRRTRSMRHTIVYRNSPCSQRRNHVIMRGTFPATSFPAYLAFFLVAVPRLSPRNSRRDSWEITGQFVRHYAHSYSTMLNRICIQNVMQFLTVKRIYGASHD